MEPFAKREARENIAVSLAVDAGVTVVNLNCGSILSANQLKIEANRILTRVVSREEYLGEDGVHLRLVNAEISLEDVALTADKLVAYAYVGVACGARVNFVAVLIKSGYGFNAERKVCHVSCAGSVNHFAL